MLPLVRHARLDAKYARFIVKTSVCRLADTRYPIGLQPFFFNFQLPFKASAGTFEVMRGTVAFATLALIASPVEASGLAPLYDAVTLNIGVNCQWQHSCIAEQNRAMKRALKYVQKYQPPFWRIHACNKNASRGSDRVDWVGFDNCIRNAAVRPLPPRVIRRR